MASGPFEGSSRSLELKNDRAARGAGSGPAHELLFAHQVDTGHPGDRVLNLQTVDLRTRCCRVRLHHQNPASIPT